MTATAGDEAFIEGLQQHGIDTEIVDGVVCFRVLAATGALAGTRVETGVAVNELQGWPMVPPHWVHLPGSITIAPTNTSSTETRPGWVRHSRGIQHWGSDADLVNAWLGHVRSVLEGAVA